MELSVIVPIYNSEKYLKICLSSIGMKPLEKIEIIAINDCSTDHSF